MRVCFIASDTGGSGHIRSKWPSDELNRRGWDTWVSMHFINAGPADVVVSHRPLDSRALDCHRALQKDGKLVIVDEDDDLTAIPPRFYQGNYDHSKYAPLLRCHDIALAEADGALFSTPRLAEVYGHIQPNYAIVPNYLPEWISAIEFYHPRSRNVHIGWAGIVDTHEHDLLWLQPHAPEMFRTAAFTTVGDPTAASILGAWGQVETYPFERNLEDFYMLMARADIGIVPLDKDGAGRRLNLSKSWLKALEYCYLGKPVVVVNLPEQKALIDITGHGLVCDTPKEFVEAAITLAQDHALRDELAQKARAVRKSLTLEEQGGVWEAAIRSVLHQGSSTRRAALSQRAPVACALV
jgi:glycosyltransferase involved in cell wall biosynthesis